MSTISDEASPGVDAYLLLSFEVTGHTTILDIRGTSFHATSLPGLDLASHTLLLQRMPDQSLLQVTSKVESLAKNSRLAILIFRLLVNVIDRQEDGQAYRHTLF